MALKEHSTQKSSPHQRPWMIDGIFLFGADRAAKSSFFCARGRSRAKPDAPPHSFGRNTPPTHPLNVIEATFEIESLTSHQNERRSAPCATRRCNAAASATSPTLKKFWVARAFEVAWACTCCHDRTGFNCCLLPLSHFSLFFVSRVWHTVDSTTLNVPRFEGGESTCFPAYASELSVVF